ncbi:MAG TPA: methyltransferase domain-containing protein [Gemmatimonadales bacterium]|nr:methyltransferase domain-containing protein [Gemmatimonadales bacterium]
MIGVEVLDDPGADPALVRAELNDLALINRWFGGTRAVVRALVPLLPPAGSSCTLLDVGTGSGDIPRAVTRAAGRRHVTVLPVGLDRSPVAARIAVTSGLATVVSDGGSLPLASGSVDFVVASQVLHHLEAPAATRWIQELHRVARRAVIIADLRRSRMAMLAMWLVSFPLGLHPATRRDAVLSLRRGYTVAELGALLHGAGVRAVIWRSPIARLVAVWQTSC